MQFPYEVASRGMAALTSSTWAPDLTTGHAARHHECRENGGKAKHMEVMIAPPFVLA